ncbi:hypothetical protein [Thiolapillus sp.]
MNTSLFLFPLPALEAPPEFSTVRAALEAGGFLGTRLDQDRYAVGPRFFNYMTFAGCSPHLQMETSAEGGWRFCHLQIHADESPRLRMIPRRSRPRCPACRSSLPGWSENLEEWKRDASRMVRCPACDARMPVGDLDWRQYGLASRCSVEIHQVYPGEALPQDGLLQLLGEATGRTWSYAWAES